ncbi:MAG: pyridoxal-5'-phosphate-dependent protein beta subunit [Chloroflexi bacterium]|jgi:threonine dehydratase|nr:pyridoxal-5'-phosphate-dependent protein beta subunit [Chloroflexota bacterium]
MINITDIQKAYSNISINIHRTPISTSTYLSQKFNSKIFFKQELFQKTGSFKIRGVLNKLSSLSSDQLKNGVISLSSGNHAQAVAYGSKIYNISSTIVMPTYSTKSKIEATKGYGAKVIITDEELITVVKEIQKETNATLIHPFDDDHIIAGQGTLGLEITEDMPEIDHIFTAIGGGGLISGICIAMKAHNPKIKIIGIEPEGADGMRQSLKKRKPVTLDSINTIADGLSAPFIGEKNFEIVQKHIDQLITVSDKEIIETMWLIFERTKLFVEPSAAAGLAPILFDKYKLPNNSKAMFILCGGNIDKEKLIQISN